MAISVVLSLLVRHCYSCLKIKSRLHILISTVVHAEVVCAPKILPIGFFLDHTLRSKIIAPSIPKLFENFAENEHFLLAFPSSLRSNYTMNKQTGDGRGRDLDTRSISLHLWTVVEIGVCSMKVLYLFSCCHFLS